jgi:DNA polymerase-3 subunit delta
VIVGDEELLVERAVTAAVALAVAADAIPEPGDAGFEDGDVQVHQVAAAGLGAGELSGLTAPSLFGGGCVVVVRSAQDAGKDLAAELIRLASAPPPDVFLVVAHAGGAKNKALLADLLKTGARRVDCPSVKRFGERMDFLRGEFRQAGRKADDAGLRALLDAVGNDLRDLAAACSQLAADTTGVVNQAVVARYYHGRAEATGFSVADKACEGSLADALELLRWALATGTSPVLISSALAQGLRTLGLVGSVGRGLSANALAGDLGMPPWKIDKARQQLSARSARSSRAAPGLAKTACAHLIALASSLLVPSPLAARQLESYDAVVSSTKGTMWVDPHSPVALHEQVAAVLRRAIADGETDIGERLPPARDLAAVMGVNANTVFRALRTLRDEGLVEFRRGRGVTVSGDALGRSAIVAKARELVLLARRCGYPPDELAKIIEQVS